MRKSFKILMLLVSAPFLALHISGLFAASSDPDISEVACEFPGVPIYAKGTYDREKAAADYLLFAVASLNAYASEEDQPKNDFRRKFDMDNYEPDWKKQVYYDPATDLMTVTYVKSTSDSIFAIVSYRGSEFNWKSWYSNFSWFTRLIPVENQYSLARKRFSEFKATLQNQANGRKIFIMTTGHSLGGGLAQHIANAFPCISAVVFNSSPVVNAWDLRRLDKEPKVVKFYDKGDPLTRFGLWLFGEYDTPRQRLYPMHKMKGFFQAHEMENLAVTMARITTDCQYELAQKRRESCYATHQWQAAKKLYCSTYGDERNERDKYDEVCAF